MRRAKPSAWLFHLAGHFCGGESFIETVTTQLHVHASIESVWNRILFYEEVPGRAPLLLGALLPQPLRTQGDKTRIGANVQCIYVDGKSLAKRITRVKPPYLLQFEVTEQSLGIEDCLMTLDGSYRIERCGDASHVFLRTRYEARLHPRWLWQRVEALLITQLHQHILRGLSAASDAPRSENRVLSPASLAPLRVCPGGMLCKSRSCSHL